VNIHPTILFIVSGFGEIGLRLGFACNIALVSAMSHWMSGPRQWRGGTFFNVRVEPGFAASEAGRAILHRFRRRIWLWAGLMEVLYFPCSLRWNPVMAPLPLLLILYATMIGCIRAFSWASRQTREQAIIVAGSSVRAAELFVENEKVDWWVAALEWLGMLLPLILPAATAVILTIHWRQLRPNETHSSMTDVFSAAFLGLMSAGNQFALRFHARSSDWNRDPRASRKYRAILGALYSSVFTFLTLEFCFLAVMPIGPFHNMDGYSAFTLTGWPIVLILVLGIRWWLKRNLSRESSDPMPDSCWKWGVFYVNPADPAFVVPARTGTGFSYNCGQRAVWITLATVAVAMVIDLV
jgi:hypothetical protein